MRYGNLYIPDDFITELREGRLVLLVGSGASSAAGLPDGPTLAAEVGRRCGISIEGMEKEADYYQRLVFCGIDAKGTVRDIIQECCRGHEEGAKPHETLLDLFAEVVHVAIVTTNFDPLLDRTCEHRRLFLGRRAWPDLPPVDGDHPLRGAVYLHGSARDSEFKGMILTAQDFHNAYFDTASAALFLRNLCRRRPVALVGASANDPIYDHLQSSFEDSSLKHYAFVPEADLAHSLTGVQRLGHLVPNLECIRYAVLGKSHHELWQGLELVAQESTRIRERKEGIRFV